MTNNPLYVTQPSLPPLAEFERMLADIWRRKWLTNNGHYHRQLEAALAESLGVECVSLFCNGTVALELGLRALDVAGEVITTPFSFPATTHAIGAVGCKPVFCDVDPVTGNLDPGALEARITACTAAILPVHVYGTPCDTEAIGKVAERHGLRVLYDAAHAFGVTRAGRSILRDGDLSMLSFHATKVYNTVEGGALISADPEQKTRIDRLKNFGFVNETTVEEAGSNGKMNELQSAYGLLQLKTVDEQIAARLECSRQYREALKDLPGLRLLAATDNVRPNGSYFPVFVDADAFGMTRDALCEALKERNIFARRYFYPLISDLPMYRDCVGAAPRDLPNATRISREALCLPLFADMTEADVNRVVKAIRIQSRHN